MPTFITYRQATQTPPGSTTTKGTPLTNAEVDGNMASLASGIDTVAAAVAAINKTSLGLGNVDNTSDANKPISTATATALSGKQATLVTGTNIRTIAGQALLGTSDITFKTINSAAIQGTGDIALQTPLVSGTSIKTINGASVLASGDISLPTISSTDTFTNKTITALKETRVAMGANNIDLSAGNVFTKTITATTTLTVSNVASSGSTSSFILDLTNGGAFVITWWAGMKWANGSAPTLTAAGRDLLGFFTHDGGTTWNGYMVAKGMA